MEDDNPVDVRPSPTDNASTNGSGGDNVVKSDSKTSQISLDYTTSNSNESDMSLGSETDQKSDILNVTVTRHSWHADETAIKGDCIGGVVDIEIENHQQRREV